MSSQPGSLLRKGNGKALSIGSASRTSFFGTKGLFDSITNQGVNGLLINNSNGIGTGNGTGSGVNINSTASKRRSILSTPASTSKRRQSLYQATTSQPSNSQQTPLIPLQGSSQQTPSSQITPDQRPLRNKNYITLISQEIYEYLINNQFERMTDHSLTQKTLKNPTQKDFTVIFKFIYNKLDSSHEFSKAIDIEVFALLKNLGYPFLDTINRSQISAVGGQNWPSFLGMLYWLVKLNINMEDILETGLDGSIIWSQVDPEKILMDFLTKSYRGFLHEKDDYDSNLIKLSQDFQNLKVKLNEDIENLQQENLNLKNQHNHYNQQMIQLQKAETKSKALEDDLVTFKAYIETMENRKVQWAESLQKIRLQIDNLEEFYKQKEQEKLDLQQKLKSQNITIELLDNIDLERDKLSKNIDSLNDDNLKLNQTLEVTEIELAKNYQSLDNFIKNYNNAIEKIKPIKHDFIIKLNPEILINRQANSSRSFNVDQIINKVLKQEKISLLQLNHEILENINKICDQQLKIEEECNNLQEKTSENSEAIETISSKILSLKSTYDENYQNMINNTNQISTENEKLEREMRTIKIKTDQEYITLENQFQRLSMIYDELSHSTSRSKSELSNKCQKISYFVGNFILDNRTYLLHLLDYIDQEYENEQNDINDNEQ